MGLCGAEKDCGFIKIYPRNKSCIDIKTKLKRNRITCELLNRKQITSRIRFKDTIINPNITNLVEKSNTNLHIKIKFIKKVGTIKNRCIYFKL